METLEWFAKNIAFAIVGIAGLWLFIRERKINLEKDENILEFHKSELAAKMKMLNMLEKLNDTIIQWGQRTSQDYKDLEIKTEKVLIRQREDTIRREAIRRARLPTRPDFPTDDEDEQ